MKFTSYFLVIFVIWVFMRGRISTYEQFVTTSGWDESWTILLGGLAAAAGFGSTTAGAGEGLLGDVIPGLGSSGGASAIEAAPEALMLA